MQKFPGLLRSDVVQSLENLLRRVLISENIPVEHLEYWLRNIPSTTLTVSYLGKDYDLVWVLPRAYIEISDEEFNNHLRQVAFNKGVGSAMGVWEVGIRGIRAATLPYELRRLCNSGSRWVDPADFKAALDRFSGIPEVGESLDALSKGIVTAAVDYPQAFLPISKYLEVCMKYPKIPITSLADLNKIDLRVFPIPSRLFGALVAWLRQNGKDPQPSFTAFLTFVQSANLAMYCRVQQASEVSDLCTGIVNWVNTRSGTLRHLAATIIAPDVAREMDWQDTSVKKSDTSELVVSKEILERICAFWEDSNPSSQQVEFYLKWKEFLQGEITHDIFEQMSQDFSGVR